MTDHPMALNAETISRNPIDYPGLAASTVVAADYRYLAGYLDGYRNGGRADSVGGYGRDYHGRSGGKR